MNTVSILIPVLAVCVLVLILAEFGKKRTLIYIFKPISTLLVIGTAVLGVFAAGGLSTYSLLILIGLGLSLVGDMALMPPDEPRKFKLGLIFFLSAHIVYIAGFWRLADWTYLDGVTAVALAIFGVVFYRLLLPGLGSMKLPVIAYMVIISLMANRALAVIWTRGIDARRGLFIAAGALLFFFSDVMLSWSRFRRSWKYERISLALYYGGQLLIALSVYPSP